MLEDFRLNISTLDTLLYIHNLNNKSHDKQNAYVFHKRRVSPVNMLSIEV